MAGTFGVYMHKNIINGKVYVGITCQNPISLRWKNGLGYKKSPLFYKAIQKYGWNNFEHIILFQNLSKEDAEEKEKELIKKYKSNSREYGYNIQNGGGISDVSELTKIKLSNINIGKHHSEKTKKKMSIAHKGKQRCLGYKHSDETKEKHRLLMLREKNPRCQAVNQYDLKGNFIRTFSCMEEIKNVIHISTTAHISDCCRGKRNKCYGYIWKYSD